MVGDNPDHGPAECAPPRRLCWRGDGCRRPTDGTGRVL